MADTTIHILPDHLANQIAAGEVVQRPESVVKELVENAIDAGATSISVVVRQAGKQLIHIIDDGGGMQRADLELATVRHATSKIRTEHDLHEIRTLGFRGEALASIAAVADVEIRSQRRGEDSGYTLISRPGQAPEIIASVPGPGTQVIVRNLFSNVPARRKFLKSDLTEFRHISETMQKMALSRPDLRFTFHDGDILVFDVRPAELRRRIMDILAIDAAKHLVPVAGDENGIAVEGYVGLPSTARQSRSGQFLFLNGRPILSRSLAHAVLSAYEHLLDHGQHPVFVLHLTVDPHKVDVNVHPQKHEVKFEDERAAYLVIQAAVTLALRSAEVIPSFLGDVPLASRPLQSLPSSPSGVPTYVNRLTGEITEGLPEGLPLGLQSGLPSGLPSGSPTWNPTQRHTLGPTQRPTLGPTQRQIDALFERSDDEVSQVMQAGLQYVVTTSAEGLVAIDQHAAHERVIYERVMKRQPQDAQSGQALLFAVTIKLSPSRVTVLREYLDEFTTLGFRLEIINAGTVEIHAVPTDVQPGNEEATLEGMMQSLEDVGRLPRERRREGIAAVYAARQAMRRGDRLSGGEMRALVRDLFACSVPHLTPHGEPTYIVIPFDELVQRFR